MSAPESESRTTAAKVPGAPKNRFLSWLPVPILMLAFYVLSIGPASRLAHIGTIPWDMVQMIYAPVNLAARFGPIDDLLQWYIRDIWQVKPRAVQPPPLQGTPP